jgi:hypothetical protein
MKPLNKQERRSAFSRFLLFYCITLVIMAAIVFFGFNAIPAQQKKLSKKMDYYEKQQREFAQFSVLVDTITMLQRTSEISNASAMKSIADRIYQASKVGDSTSSNRLIFDRTTALLYKIQINNEALSQKYQDATEKNLARNQLNNQIDSLNKALKKCQGDQKAADRKADQIDYDKIFFGILDSVVKFRTPYRENVFSQYLCNGGQTPVIIEYQEKTDKIVRYDTLPHVFKDVYSKLGDTRQSRIIKLVKCDKGRKKGNDCVVSITIIWQNKGGLHLGIHTKTLF